MKTYKRRGTILRIDAEDGYFGGKDDLVSETTMTKALTSSIIPIQDR